MPLAIIYTFYQLIGMSDIYYNVSSMRLRIYIILYILLSVHAIITLIFSIDE